MEALQCSKCKTQDHHGKNNYFCNCEGRNIKLAKELRERGINAWEKPEHIDVYADTEEEFVEKSLTTRRPCTVWMRGSLDQKKIDQLLKERGIVFVNTSLDQDKNGTIYL